MEKSVVEKSRGEVLQRIAVEECWRRVLGKCWGQVL